MNRLTFALAVALSLIAAEPCHAQSDVPGTATGTCVLSTAEGGDGRPHPCSDFNRASSSGSANSVQAATAQALGEIGDELIYKLLFGGNKNNAEATAAAAAAAAERQRQAELARQRALEEQRRQRIFQRLSGELKDFDNGPTLQFKDFDGGSSGLQLKDFGEPASAPAGDLKPQGTSFFGLGGGPASKPCAAAPASSTTSGGGLQLKDFGATPAPAANSGCAANSSPATATNSSIVDLRNCGGPSQPCPSPSGDFGVVDLQSVQQGVNLAAAAANLPAGDRQVLLDQALRAANGDRSVQAGLPSNSAVPVVTQAGLLAFQQANAEYRKSYDSSYTLRKAFEDAEKKCEMGDAIAKVSQAQLEADLQNHIDQMTLAQKQEAVAKIFQAALDRDLACGDDSAKLDLALQNTDWTRYQAEGVLAKIAKVPAPSAPKYQPISDSDMKLLLPDAPDMNLAKDTVLHPAPSAPGPPESDMELVKDSILHQPPKLPAEAVTQYPPAFAQKYRTDPSFALQASQMHASIYENLSKDYSSAAREASRAWQNRVSELTQKGVLRPDVPLAPQESASPQLHVELENMRTEITSRLDYECTLARYHAENAWSNWVATQDAALTGKPAPLLKVAP